MYCPYCGTSNRDEDEFCQKCGKSLWVKVPKSSKLKVGWMVWWRAMLPMEAAISLLAWSLQLNLILANLVLLPVLFFLLNWAGKVVARKKYGFTRVAIVPQYLAVGFGVLPIPRIGFGIFWRVMLASIPLRLFYLMLSAFAGRSGNIIALFAQVLLLPVYVFLMIIILGWATKQTIERLWQ